ncbi:carboxylesterase family protein [Amycolatopsis jejuensis]|uniref:carboxylesterase family protein n=1 Tax=Amycolatopsis jejuensis TaxID=330084 RepID=UPI003CCBA366
MTIGYRLGLLRLPGISDGNLSLYDQVLALEWVRDNVATFGGDPRRVTHARSASRCSSPQPVPTEPNRAGQPCGTWR